MNSAAVLKRLRSPWLIQLQDKDLHYIPKDVAADCAEALEKEIERLQGEVCRLDEECEASTRTIVERDGVIARQRGRIAELEADSRRLAHVLANIRDDSYVVALCLDDEDLQRAAIDAAMEADDDVE